MHDATLSFARVGAVGSRNALLVNLQGITKGRVRVDEFNSDISTAIGNF